MIMAMASEPCLKSMENAADITKKMKKKMRKPIIEKKRRDRINSYIKNIHKLLEQEFQVLKPDSKLDKADILDVAVKFINQQQIGISQRMKPDDEGYKHGYYKCLHEAFLYLSGQQASVKLLYHFHQLETQSRCLGCLQFSPKAISEQANPQPLLAHALWRPW